MPQEILKQLLQDQKLVFSQEPQKAEGLLEIGEYPFDPSLDTAELAAYTIVANTILNLTETMRKG